MGTHLEAAKTPMEGQVNAHQHVEDVPLDFVDPHRAALESNPEHSEIPSLSTLLAVAVGLVTAFPCYWNADMPAVSCTRLHLPDIMRL